jgi:hypothetical protein
MPAAAFVKRILNAGPLERIGVERPSEGKIPPQPGLSPQPELYFGPTICFYYVFEFFRAFFRQLLL